VWEEGDCEVSPYPDFARYDPAILIMLHQQRKFLQRGKIISGLVRLRQCILVRESGNDRRPNPRPVASVPMPSSLQVSDDLVSSERCTTT
jgi:hypothetical protein